MPTTTPRKLRLTKASVAAITPPEGDKPLIVWDRDLAGFGVRVQPSGRRVYFLQARTKKGRGIKVTLGNAKLITAEMARERARAHLATIELGGDPSADLKAAREAEQQRQRRPVGMTFRDLSNLWLDDARRRLRPKTVDDAAGMLDRHILGAIGEIRVKDVAREHLAGLQRSITRSGAIFAANRVTGLVSAIYGWAMEHDPPLAEVNPAARVKKNPERPRERALNTAEIGQLLAVLDRRDDVAARVVKFLLATGARRGETLICRWRDLDLDAGVWSKPHETTKGRRSHRVPLNAAALAILEAQRGAGPTLPGARVFVIEGWQLSRRWDEIRAEAGLVDVRLHDLRHSYASILAAAGHSLPIIGAMLGHRSPSTTNRYAHLLDDPLRKAGAGVDAALERARAGTAAEILPFPTTKKGNA